MKYISIDIETTGLDPRYHQILEFGCVVEDTEDIRPVEELPTFRYLFNHDEIIGEAQALAMNAELLEEIAKGEKAWHPDAFVIEFLRFLTKHGFKRGERINVAGKNVAWFDMQFLRNVDCFEDYIDLSHKVLDPGILFMDWTKDDAAPGLSKCLRRAGLPDAVSHRAVDDAKQVVELLRKATNDYTRGWH